MENPPILETRDAPRIEIRDAAHRSIFGAIGRADAAAP